MNSFFQKYYTALIKGGIIAIFLAVMLVIPHYEGIWDSSITIPLLILFWLGAAYIVLPDFFKKYRVAILSVYGLVIAYNFFIFNIAPNQAENHRLYLTNFMFIPVPVFTALWVYEQWRWLRILKVDKTRAELALLKSQVNPHFFFNTLNNLYGLVVEKSPQAPEVVLGLSDMMRYTIYEGKKEWVGLTDEINFLETYIELHKIRYRKKVAIQFDHKVDGSIQVAPLLFINLLENAFKHGVEPSIGNAYIYLRLKTQDGRILFHMKNNCESDISPEKGGVGLHNLKKRLELIYPNGHELRIEKTKTTYAVHLNLNTH